MTIPIGSTIRVTNKLRTISFSTFISDPNQVCMLELTTRCSCYDCQDLNNWS